MKFGEFIGIYTRRAASQSLRVDCPMAGSLGAQIALVGEAPGEHECRNKSPFVGGSGKFMFDSVRKIGITRTTVYMTNVIKRQLSLSANSDARAEIEHNEIVHWNEMLWWELSHLPNLSIVVALGNQAIDALLGMTGVEKLVGSVYEVTNPINGATYRVLCNYNPAYPMREPTREITFRFAFAKVRRLLEGTFTQHELNPIVNPGADAVHDYIEELASESEVHGTPVSFDIETIAMETACIGIGNSPTTAMCIALRDIDTNHYTVEEECRIYTRLQTRLLGNPSVKLVAQNGSFDSYWLELSDRIHVAPIWLDTMLAHHCLYPALPHNLGFLTMQYTDMPYYKDELHKWREGGDIQQFWEYNCKDVVATWIAAQKLEAELKRAKLDGFFFEHVMRAQPHLIGMTVGGVPVDVHLKEHLAETVQADCDELLERFHIAARIATGKQDYSPLPTSPKQMKELYFGRLGLVGRGTKVDVHNRRRMFAHPRTSDDAREVIRCHNAYVEQQKFLSTYVRMAADEDGRIRSEYKQTGTVSAPGRLSSAGLLYGTGGNLQNQPERAQPMFALPPGYVYVYYDLGQAEARFVGWDAGIDSWIDDFERARVDSAFDCHRSLAAQLFNVPYDEVPLKDTDEMGNRTIRYVAKRCRHGLNYRMGPDRLAETADMDRRDAERNYNLYHRLHPELRRWWEWLTEKFKRERCLYNAYGRKLPLLQRLDDDALESIVAFRPQSTIGDKCTRVIYLCHDDDRWPTGDAAVRLNIHDANIAICKERHAMTVAAIMKEHAEEPIMMEHWKQPLIIPADVKISYPVAWEATDDGIRYYEDPKGLHRWGFFKEVEL